MKKILRFSFVALLAMICGSAFADDKTDELTWEGLGLNGANANYAAFADKTFNSTAVYAGTASSGTGKYIQLRSNKSDAGIVTTASGGKLKSVTITFNTGTTDRAIDIYGKNEAYSEGPDMYDADKKGELIGTIAANGESMTVTPTKDFKYVGMVAHNGAIYIDKITVVWAASEGGDTKTATKITFAEGYKTQIAGGPDDMFPEIGTSVALPTATVMAGDATVGNNVEWSLQVKSWKGKDGKPEPSISDGKINVADGHGVLEVTASYAGNDTYEASTKKYTLTVYNSYGLLKEMAEDIADPDCIKDDEDDVDGKPVFYFFRNIDADGFPAVTSTVTFVNGKYIYLTDGDGANLLFYGTNSQNLKKGDVISGNVSDTNLGGFWGYLKRYKKLPEFAFTNMNVKVESEGATVEPTTITIDQLKDNINAYVIVENAEFVSASSKNLTFKVGETELALYNQFSVDATALEANAKYTIEGMVSVNKKDKESAAVYQLYPISFTKAAEETTTDQVWDFTTWSAETVAALKADAAASKTSGWSDVEKQAEAEADADPTETSKDNCFWCIAEPNEDGSLSANGQVIAELKGLIWNSNYTVKRSLAIAVNYPTALGDYAGGAYLWLGGGKKKVPCFTIPSVKAGSTVTMEVESHKPAEGRGVELYTGVDGDGLVDAATKIGDTFTPTTKDSHTWTVENDCDVIVYNTDGCHLYSVKVALGDETGISSVAETKKVQNGTIYNMAGQVVDKGYKGLVIVNGKKYVNK